MADLKISDLTESTTSEAGDFYIINKGDATTQKINAINLGRSNSYPPIVFNCTINQSLSNTSGSVSWTLGTNGASGTVRYPMDMGADRIFDVFMADPVTKTMPPGANAAVVFFEGAVEGGAAGLDGLATTSTRSIHTAHRLSITGADFPYQWPDGVKEGFGLPQKCVVILNGNSDSIVLNRVDKRHFSKYDIITFTEGAQVTFQARTDVLKGGRARITSNAGRILLIPFFNDGNTPFSVIAETLAKQDNNGFYYNTNSDLEDIYDEISPIQSPADKALELGRDDRSNLRHMVSSLESRKNHPPAGGASITEYDAVIGDIWALLDNPTLTTHEVFEAAVEPVMTEAKLPKYGVGDLFAFETAAGATGRTTF